MNWLSIKNYLFPWLVPAPLLFGRTDTGRTRPENEDSFAILPERRLMMVADGMGGHNAGEVASNQAIESMIDLLNEHELKKASGNKEEIEHLLMHALHQTNNNIMAMSEADEKFTGMGCTFIVAFIDKKHLYTCHVGDVRGYLYNADGWRQITTDHSYAADFEKKMAESADVDDTIKAPARNIVSRAMGFPFKEDPECHCLSVRPGDRILICSDGLWSMMPDEHLQEIIIQAESPEVACDLCISEANAGGGRDNITAAVSFV
jgi:protein phosphatase